MVYELSPEGVQMLLILLGVILFAHAVRIANECPKKTPNLFVIFVSGILGCGVAIVYEALHGDLLRAMAFSVASCALQLASSLWLWSHGIKPKSGPSGEFLAPGINEEFDRMEREKSLIPVGNSGSDDFSSTTPDHWWDPQEYNPRISTQENIHKHH